MLYLTTYSGLLFLRLAQARSLYFVLLIGLFVFSAFRFQVGCDWSGYLNQFQVYRSVDVSAIFQSREPLWLALFAFQDWLGLPYPWINVFSSAIFFLGIHVLARRQPDPLGFLVLLFPILIINMPMSGIRQATAIGVTCVAFTAFIDRRLVRFVAFTVLAAAFHSSAMVFLLLAPLVHGSYSRNRLLLSGLLAVPGALALLSTEAAETAMTRYVESGIDAAGATFRVAVLAATAPFFLRTLRRKWEVTFPGDYKLAVIGSWMMLALVGLLPLSSVIADRLGYYLIPIQTMILARVSSLPIRANRQILIAAPYLALLAVFAVWTSLSWHFEQCYVPYRSWLFGFPEGYHFY